MLESSLVIIPPNIDVLSSIIRVFSGIAATFEAHDFPFRWLWGELV